MLQNKNIILKILVGAAIGFLFLSLIFNIYDVSLWGMKASANGFSIIFEGSQAVADMMTWLAISSIIIILVSVAFAILFIINVKNEDELPAKLQMIICGASVALTFIYMINGIVACGKFSPIEAKMGAWAPFVIEIVITAAVFVVNYLKKKEKNA